VAQWQVYFFRGNAWSNAQSSADVDQVRVPAPPASGAGGAAGAGGAVAAAPRTVLPSGVRIVLEFADGSGFSGGLTRDIRLGPQVQ
jgi:general secretion pathway protein J